MKAALERAAMVVAVAAGGAVLAVPPAWPSAPEVMGWVGGKRHAPDTGQNTLGAPSRLVNDDAEFEAAVADDSESGGTIVLARHSYGELVVPPRSARPLRIIGLAGARVGRIDLDRTQDVSLQGLTVEPDGKDAWVSVNDSSHVDLDRLLLTAKGTTHHVTMVLAYSSHVTVRRSTFTHCGDRYRGWANCLLPFWASHVLVSDSWFHDCYGCDFIHGRFERDLVLRGNRFDRSLPCAFGRRRCEHQDLIELFAGDGLTVVGNRFGLYRRGGAQLNLPDRIDHVRVANNLFLAGDPRFPAYRSRVAIVLGYRHVSRYVTIVNNTILSGARRRDGFAGSIRMSSLYGTVPRSQRPVLANNVVALVQSPQHVCSELRASVRNVVLDGRPCGASDLVGDAALGAGGRPTARSTALIDRGAVRYAPADDIDGVARDARPDIGAFEYVGARRVS